MTQPFATSVSIDYSDDELDAIASAFLRADLARRPDRATDSAVRRAQHQTALRGLVARRAIALTGGPAKPRITFFEPHATMLQAFLNAGAVATVRTEERNTMRAVSLFAGDDAVVHQAAIEGQAIQRMTAHPRFAAPELLAAELTAAPDAAAPPASPIGPDRFDLTRAALRAAITAVDRGNAAPRDVPTGAADVLYARRSSGTVSIAARDRDGARVAGSWTWVDAGELGFWQVRGHDRDDSYVSLLAADPQVVADEIQAAWAHVLLEAAPAPQDA